MNDSEVLYGIINDFIEENQLSLIELFGVFQMITMEQGFAKLQEKLEEELEEDNEDN